MIKISGNYIKKLLSILAVSGMLVLFSSSLVAQESISLEEELPAGLENLNINEMTAQQGSDNHRARRAYGYWYDNAQGPGQLPTQGEYHYSGLMSGYGSGYMKNITYSWQGNFNGWRHVIVYLCIFNSYGQCVGAADVTDTRSGDVAVPAGTYPATYDVAFVYYIDRVFAGIYDGPSFGWVSAHVKYQY